MGSPLQIADAHLGGKLEEMLRKWRDEEESFDEMAQMLKRMNVPTSREQVRRWCIALNIPTDRVKDSA